MISRTYDRNILDIYIYILLNNLYTRRTRMTHPEQGEHTYKCLQKNTKTVLTGRVTHTWGLFIIIYINK